MARLTQKNQNKSGISGNYRKTKGKPVVYMGIFLATVLIMAILYNPSRQAGQSGKGREAPVKGSSSGPVFTKQGELTFYKPDSTVAALIDIEIADDDALRERGLMYRREMEMNQGMLFIFGDDDYRSFWMKNTYLPLDILYVDASKEILQIHENVSPLNEKPIPSDKPARYVVEVVAGFCALNRLAPGDHIGFVRKRNP